MGTIIFFFSCHIFWILAKKNNYTVLLPQLYWFTFGPHLLLICWVLLVSYLNLDDQKTSSFNWFDWTACSKTSWILGGEVVLCSSDAVWSSHLIAWSTFLGRVCPQLACLTIQKAFLISSRRFSVCASILPIYMYINTCSAMSWRPQVENYKDPVPVGTPIYIAWIRILSKIK